MSLRIVESTSLPSSSADQQCIHGKAMSQRCDECATHRLAELRAANLIRRLCEWAELTGGWEAPVWAEAKAFDNRAKYVSNDPASNAARLVELQRVLADDPTLESVSDEDEFREELAALEGSIASALKDTTLKNRHGQTCADTCGAMAKTGFHSALCHSVERQLQK